MAANRERNQKDRATIDKMDNEALEKLVQYRYTCYYEGYSLKFLNSIFNSNYSFKNVKLQNFFLT